MKLFEMLELNLKGVILIILIPVLLIIILSLGWIGFHEMRQTVLHNFDQKLMGVSSTTGAFIDGDDFEKLARAKEIKAMTFEDKHNLYAVDTKNRFIHINLDDGAGKIVFPLDKNITDITYDSHLKLFFATSQKEILTIDLANQKTKIFYMSNTPLGGIAYVRQGNFFYMATNHGIVTLNKEKVEKKVLKSTEIFKSLAYNAKKGILYALKNKTDNLCAIDIDTLKESRIKYKNFPPDTSQLKSIEFNDNKLYSGNKHLIIYDLNRGKSIFKNFARGYRDERSALYKKYIIPMTTIKMGLNLTYLYTQKLIYNNSKANCYYVLDVQEGTEYTPIGSEDEMDTKILIGAEDVLFKNILYVSDIQPWEQWGLLKTAFAPITNKQGIVKGIAGADIDISIINEKTKKILVETLIIGIISILISIFIAIWIAKKIIKPIQKLKYAALRIAAERYAEKVFIKNPKELSELATTFNTMNSKLKDTLSDIVNYNSELFLKRKEEDIKSILSQQYPVEHDRVSMYYSENTNRIDGVLLSNNILYFWFSSKLYDNSIFAIKQREVMATTLSKLINKTDNPLKELQLIFKEIDQFGYINLDKNYVFIDSLSKNLDVLVGKDNQNYILQELKKGLNKIEGDIIFAQSNILKNLTNEQISYLLQAKQSNIHLKQFSVLLAIIQKERL